jgi:hypothetical protein
LQTDASGIDYIAGFYEFSATDANLDEGATSITYGDANNSYAAHASIVAGGAGSVNSGQVALRVTGTSINDDGVRTTLDSEILISDITNLTADQYLETSKKWLGTITFELFIVSGVPTVYGADFNYGISKYEDFGNNDFTVQHFEVVGRSGAGSASNFDVTLFHHSSVGWTYAATGFVAGGDVVAQLSADHLTDDEINIGEYFAFKRANLNEPVSGANSEGVVISVSTSTGQAIEYLDAHVGVLGLSSNGITGAQGPAGSPTGFQGPGGPQGFQGNQGLQGVVGANSTIEGPQGNQGDTGVQGTQGVVGFQGVQGFQGDVGFQGDAGATGAVGDQGTQGPQGIQGTQGVQGVQGLQGVQGVQGFQGTTGFQGDVGAQGTEGPQGVAGLQGATGIDGAQGSAGDAGVQGFQGEVGEAGATGVQGPVVPTGPLPRYLTGTDAYVVASALGVTYGKAAGVGTITIPEGEDLYFARVNGTDADTVTDTFILRVTYAGAEYNNTPGDAQWPEVSVVDKSLEDFGGPTVVTPFPHNNGEGGVGLEYIALGSGSIDIRITAISFLKWAIIINQ